MGNNLFGADIAGKLAKALGPGLLPMTLIKVVPGTRTPTDPSAGTNPTRRSFPCRGILDTYKLGQIDGTIIKHGDRKALILGGTLPKGVSPEPNDEVKIEGSTFTVCNPVERDPDAASYLCQVR